MRAIIFSGLFFISFFSNGQHKIQLIAHRGGIVSGVPENTLETYRRCLGSGIDVIEVDLRATSDRQIVIMHDKDVDRTTNGIGLVSSFSLEEIRKLDAGGGNTVPTFGELIALIEGQDIKLLLDLKQQQQWYREEIMRLLRDNNVTEQIIIGAKSLEDISFFGQQDERMLILGFVPNQEVISSFIEGRADIIRLWPDWVLEGEEKIDVPALASKTQVWVTTGDLDTEKVRILAGLGVSGFIHDDPWALLRHGVGGQN